MRRFGLIGLLITVLIAGAAGVIGYNWGYSAGLANTAAANGTTVLYGPGYGFGFGFPFFGVIFGILFFVLIFALIRRAAPGWGGPGRHAGSGYGRGGWGRGEWGDAVGTGGPRPGAPAAVPPFVDGMLQDWHREAHGRSAPTTDGTDTRTSSTGGSSPA